MASLRTTILLTLAISLPFIALTVARSQASDELQSAFGPTLAAIQRAELAGATADELKQLVGTLNTALQLNDEAVKLTQPNETARRSQILVQINQVLDGVGADARQLEGVATQRTFMNKVLAYTSAGITALIGTVAYAYGVSFWHKYRVKRTMQMRVIPKK